ncbi:MAG: arginine--tRNA ligase, partial [Candidatus Gracilibacteria bacterium]|nr:arginine--tRNA ligase [Candidatus Gracilibacteria bacterium]
NNGFISLKDGAMSTRKGRIIRLDALLDEAVSRAKNIILEKRSDFNENELEKLANIIGIGAIKYGYLSKNRTTDVVFDWDEFMTFEGNSGPYIQYAYVRARNILAKSEIDYSVKTTYNFLEKEETSLLKTIFAYSSILDETVKGNFPHILAGYAYDLTKKFNSFYNNITVINEENIDIKIARLQLVEMFSIVLKDVFGLLAIEMPEKM